MVWFLPFFLSSLPVLRPWPNRKAEHEEEVSSQGISDSISETVANALPNLWISLAQLGAFLVMVAVFFFFAYRPIKEKLKKRSEYQRDMVNKANQNLAQAEKAKETAENNIQASRNQANEIIQAAEKEAKMRSQKIMDNAQVEIDRKMKQGEIEIAERKALLERKAHNEIVSTALDASKAILGRELTQQDNDKIVDDFISRIEKENDSHDGE